MLPSIDRKIFYGSDYPEVCISGYKDYFINKVNYLGLEKASNILFNNINRFFDSIN